MDTAFTKLFPTWYKLPPKERTYQSEIIVNWLQLEVDPSASIKMPILTKLRGWRNVEVWYYVTYEMPDWTARVYS
jgi:hypothetical protein